jgi:hypothetical protein
MGAFKNTIKYGKEYRKCSVKECGKVYPATKEYFSPQKIKQKNGDIWYGLRPECKECRRKKGRLAWHKKKDHYDTKNIIDRTSGNMGLL